MFWDEVEKHYAAGSAHQFLLHFNVNDLLYDDAYGYLPAVDYFMEQLNVLGCDLVLGYNTAHGIRLPNVGQVAKHTENAATDAKKRSGATAWTSRH